jgi:uncharacterized protein YkwD
VIPEINAASALKHHGIIANPNCAAIISITPLWPIHRQNPIRRLIISTYQAASGAGAAGMEELRESTPAYLEERPYRHTVLPHPYAFNHFSHNTEIDAITGYNEEETKVIEETRKIFADPTFRITATCVRAPVLRTHCVALNFECEVPISAAAVREILAAAPGVKIVDDMAANYFPMPKDASGQNAILVGRVRQDVSDPTGRSIAMFVAGDQLLKGAALNAVQIAESLVAQQKTSLPASAPGARSIHSINISALPRYAIVLVLGVAAAAHALSAAAALPDAMNAIRAHGCAGLPGGGRPLKVVRTLDEVARRIANGSDLHAALTASGYSAEQSALIHVVSAGGEAAEAHLIEQHFCAQISAPALHEIGITRRGADIWVVLAVPLPTPRPADAPAVSRRVLELVNEARAHARLCGDKSFNAAPSLKLSVALAAAALAHSLDMAMGDYFEHQGRDGSTPSSRVTRTGYAWQVVGENIAAGVATPEEAVEGWLQSPAHCENLMDPRFTDMAVAYVVNPRNPSVILWTQVFAALHTTAGANPAR